MRKSPLLVLLACAFYFLSACGGGSAPPPPSVPTVTLSASSGTVNLGESTTLTWSSTNATSCTASSNPSESDWSGQKTTSGSQQVAPVLGTTTYSLQCSGIGGSVSESAPVTANFASLTIAFASLPQGTVGRRYNPKWYFCGLKICWRYGFKLNAAGGISPYSWSWSPAAGSSLPTAPRSARLTRTITPPARSRRRRPSSTCPP